MERRSETDETLAETAVEGENEVKPEEPAAKAEKDPAAKAEEEPAAKVEE